MNQFERVNEPFATRSEANSSIKHKEPEMFYHLHIRQTGKLTVWVMVSKI